MSTMPIRDAAFKVDANEANLACSTFEDVRLSESTFKQVTFQDAKFEDVIFDGCTLRRVSLANVNIAEAHYEGMTIEGISVKEMLELYRKQASSSPDPK
jgi:uncharacterized protein YjbI with pentapeptide repeats